MALLMGAGARGVDALTRLYPGAMGYRLESRKFTQEVDTYTVLTLKLSDYVPSTRELPAGFGLAVAPARAALRTQEKKLLQETFEDWYIPYGGNLPGWRDESPSYMLHDGKLVGGMYLCAGNEFVVDNKWGQLHYFYVELGFRGKGLHSLLVAQAISTAKSWGLQGVYINTDRQGLPDVYSRWGAKVRAQVHKSSWLPYNEFGNLLRRFRWRARLLQRNWFSPSE